MKLFSEADILLRAGSSLLPQAPETWNRSDDDMNERARMIPENVKLRPAAVLIPIIMRGDEAMVLLTERTAHLSNHAGQVAFPGGRRDAGETALAAACREAHEEIGLAPEFIEPVGYLDGYLTITAYMVTPVVALIRPGFSLRAEANEVADIFEVPLAFLMTPQNREKHARDWKGMTRYYHAYPYEKRYIWGATAGMIKNLQDRMYAELEAPAKSGA
jgi:8-oxo-dGTP pyrophosphatase MutT (NUDIX family)